MQWNPKLTPEKITSNYRLNEALKAQQATARAQQQEQPVTFANSIDARQRLLPAREIFTANTGHQLQISQTTNLTSVVEHSFKLANSQLKMQCVGNTIFSTCVDTGQ